MGTAKSKYLATSAIALSFGGSTKYEESNSGRGASPNVNMEHLDDRVTILCNRFCARRRKEAPLEGPIKCPWRSVCGGSGESRDEEAPELGPWLSVGGASLLIEWRASLLTGVVGDSKDSEGS